MKKLTASLCLFFSCMFIVSNSARAQTNANIVINTDFTWKALSATPNGGFLSVGGSNAWMFNTFNAAGWPNAVAGNWGIGGIYDLPAVQHIWNANYNDSVLLRREFVIPVADSYTGSIQSQVDNQYSLYFNGALLGSGSYNPTPVANYNIAPSLQGCVNNVVAMEALNWGGPYGAKMSVNITAVNVLNSPVANAATAISCNGFTANWALVPTTDLYLVDVSTDPLFNTYYSVYHNFNAGNTTSLALTNLPGPGPYYYRLRAQRTNAAGLRVSCYSNVITVNLATGIPVNAGTDIYVCPGGASQLNGSGNGQVSWTPATGLSATNILNPTVTPLATTTYTLSITSGGCTSSDMVTVTVGNLSALQVTNDTAVCEGACLNLSVSGGDYYIWSPFAGMTDSSLSVQNICPLGSGTYQVTAYTVGPDLITNGNFSGGNTGFNSSYSYAFPNTLEGEYYVGNNPQAWNGGLNPCGDHTTGTGNMMQVNGSPVPNQNIWCQTVGVSPNTDYLFSTWVTSFTPVNPPVLQFSINGNPLGGTFSASSTSCQWDEFFTSWNSGISTSANICIVNQNTIASGNDFGLDDISFSPVCIQTESVNVTVNPAPAVVASNTGPYCNGDTVHLQSNGNANDDWTGPSGYLQNNTQNPDIISATSVMSGIYTVTVTSAAGCSSTGTTTVNVNGSMVATASNTGPYCEGDSIFLSSSNGGIDYDWTGPGGFTLDNTQNGIIPASVLSMSGWYTVTITDSAGCVYTPATEVIIHALPAINATSNSPVCETGTINFAATGTNGFDWSGPAGYTVTNNSNPVIQNANLMHSGIYTVTGTDANGCSSTALINVVVNENPDPAFTSDLAIGCSPVCFSFTDNSSITGGAAIAGWIWNVENQPVVQTQNPVICLQDPGQYDVSLTVTSSQGCSATLISPDFVQVVPMPEASFIYEPASISIENPNVHFINTSSNATLYQWELGDGNSSGSSGLQHSYADTGTYCVTLLASNQLGCIDTIQHCLMIHPFFTLYIPNSFTPNNDGINEQFMVYGNGVVKLEAYIFNRWGEEIFHFSDIQKGWGGQTLSGSYCEQAVYTYRILVKDFQNKDYEYMGNVNLIR